MAMPVSDMHKYGTYRPDFCIRMGICKKYGRHPANDGADVSYLGMLNGDVGHPSV
jgi:hypothetical protein